MVTHPRVPVRIASDATIALVAADPFSTDPDRLEEEAEAIRESVRNRGRQWRVQTVFQADRDSLAATLADLRPNIIQFTGHGSVSGQVLLESRTGVVTHVTGGTLAQVIDAGDQGVSSVILNDCSVYRGERVLAQVADIAIRVQGEPRERVALEFSRQFFRALSENADIEAAYRNATVAVAEIGILDLSRSWITSHPVDPQPRLNPSKPPQDLPPLLDEETFEGPGSDNTWQRWLGGNSYHRPPDGDPSDNVDRSARLIARDDGSYLVRVWYGTNREPKDSSDLSKGFLGRSQPVAPKALHLGQCSIVIPKAHKTGSVGSPKWKIWKRDRIRIQARQPLSVSHFWASLASAMSTIPAEERSILCFIHGFNVGFDEAAIRAAQLAFDLNFPGETAFFSWPSAGRAAKYTADEASVEASEKPLADFLSGLAVKSGAESIHIIAHSMGNRALLRAMNRIVGRASAAAPSNFTQIFLAAPDVDCEVFRDLAEVFPEISQRTTLYICPQDQALRASGSEFLHAYPRAGISPPVTVMDRVDTIEVKTDGLGLLGHSYYGSTWPVLGDIHDLITHDSPPQSRMGIRQATDRDTGLIYWVIT